MPTVIGAASAAGIEGSARYTTPRLTACIDGVGRSQVGRDCGLESLSRCEGQRERDSQRNPICPVRGLLKCHRRRRRGSIVSLRLVLCSSPLQGTLSPLRVHPMFKPTSFRSVSQERIIVRPLPSKQASKQNMRKPHAASTPKRAVKHPPPNHKGKNVSGRRERIATIDRRVVAPSRGAGSTGEPRHATRPGRPCMRGGNTTCSHPPPSPQDLCM